MGRWGLAELPTPTREVVGLMSHFASADCDAAFTEQQVERFRAATDAHSYLTRHMANSAGALRYPSARFDAARCGIALYGISPFGTDPAEDGLEPALRWDSQLAQVRQLQPGESTGYGRRFVAERPTWIGIVPVGYADGFRRDLTGTEIRVAGEPRRVVGTISMDAFAVELDRELPVGTPVTLLGHGVQAEAHARVAGTIALRARDRDQPVARADAVRDRRQLIPPGWVYLRHARMRERRAESTQRLELPIEGMTLRGDRGRLRSGVEKQLNKLDGVRGRRAERWTSRHRTREPSRLRASRRSE